VDLTQLPKFYIANNKPERLNGGDIPLYLTIKDLNSKYPNLATTLENRYHIYLQIASNITNIEKELQSEDSKKLIERLVRKYCHVTDSPMDETNKKSESLVKIYKYRYLERDDEATVPIPFGNYPMKVYSFVDKISKILPCEILDIDPKNTGLFEETIIFNSLDVRKEFMEIKKESEIWQLKEDVNEHLNDLLNVDRDLITLIDTIISEYKEKYHLSAEQLAPFGI